MLSVDVTTFVKFKAQIDHYWGHYRVSVTDMCLAHHFMALHLPNQLPHRELMVMVKIYLKWWAIQVTFY